MAARTRLPLQSLLHKNGHVFRSDRIVHTKTAIQEPVYPPIVPSLTAKSKSAKGRQIAEHLDKIRAADVQEKLTFLTRVQRKKYVLCPQTFALNADKWYQHFTKTAYLPGLPEKFIVEETKEESVPDTQNASSTIDETAFADIRSHVCHSILQENWYMKKRQPFLQREQEHYVAPFMRNLVSGLTHTMAKHNPVLQLSSLDLDPQVSFYWMRGQRTIPRGHRGGRVEPIRFQIDDKPHSQIRIPQQLPQFVPLEVVMSADVPEIKFAPDLLPMFRRQYENNIFTGAKLHDPGCYGHTQFHLVPDRYRRDKMAKRNLTDQVEVYLRANGIASLFAWTGAQAMYQGFWSHEDVTRPFVSQAVITDGQYFSFFCYQLNTLGLSIETDAGNPRKNVCWGTDSMRLYEGVKDGAVVGLDDRVLKLLVQFLLNRSG
ncbi:large ribosomal subunit protein mL65 [Salmo salar]|uniref:Large ribosomal subunit protein mL65 n=1 Tax=Salmo salar TaxID=8030 RepID=A0A1S3PH63_SALSA|nr:39S ribosomal protein S30, mitochondrial [Salmo salar]|eukprot:XP_014027008.1 PREDICTED: 28S ribosomal protein S30, mitochondrial-like [Salmo salar]